MSVILDALGLAGEALDRPGAAVRGLLAGKPRELMSIIPGSDTMGLTRPEDRTSGHDLLRQWGAVGEDDDSLGGSLAGMGVDLATNPLTYAGGFLGRALSRGMGGPGVKNLLGQRRNIAAARGVNAAGDAAEITGGGIGARQAAQKAAEEYAPRFAGQEMSGISIPGADAVALAEGAPASVGRHEMMHQFADRASRGQGEGSPLISRLVGRALGDNPGQQTGMRRALADLADETVAHGAESRGLLNQIGGGGRFLFSPNQGGREMYANLFAQNSPLVGRAYQALPYAPYAAGAGAGLDLGVEAARRFG